MSDPRLEGTLLAMTVSPRQRLFVRFGACVPSGRWSSLTVLLALLLGGCSHGGLVQHRQVAPTVTTEVPLHPNTEVIGRIQVIIARHEDTLPELAKRFNLGYEEIVAANPGVDPWLPQEGTPIVLPTRFVLPDTEREGVVLNVASMRLFYYPKPAKGEQGVVITHPVGIGRQGWATPLGRTKVVAKAEKPTWYVPASVRREHAAKGDPLPAVVPPGPDNPLGEHALRLDMPSYLIHGTNKPFGIGMRVSHGCIRMYPHDIAALYPEIPVGTKVQIVNQPYLMGWSGDGLELEIHEPLVEDVERFGSQYLDELVAQRAAAGGVPVDPSRVADLLAEPRGIPAPVNVGAPSLTALIRGAPVVRNEPAERLQLARQD